MSRVYIFLADGFEDIEGLTVVDLMRRAGIEAVTVSIKETREITTSHGIEMKTDRVFSETDFSDADMLVLPGGMPGTKYLGEHQPLTGLLTEYYAKGGKVAAICAAPSVFAKLGFLKNRKATSYPSFMDQLDGAESCCCRRKCDYQPRPWNCGSFCSQPDRAACGRGKGAGNRRIHCIQGIEVYKGT